MSNVTVQEALKAAIDWFDNVTDMDYSSHSVKRKLQMALSEIDKCESGAQCLICATGNDLPEGEYCRACGRENNMSNLGKAIKYARGGNAVPNTPLIFTSPQPIEKCEPVAEAIRERDRLGFSVVNVIGKLDEIIENTQEVEIDDFLHIAVPVDMWNELQAALEDMPKRADLYTSPQPIEKCEPVAECLICATGNDLPEGEYCRACGRENNMNDLGRAIKYARGGNSVPTKPLLYTSPQPRDWVVPSNEVIDTLWHKATHESVAHSEPFTRYRFSELLIKQLNTKG